MVLFELHDVMSVRQHEAHYKTKPCVHTIVVGAETSGVIL